jgi:hypothetical protein
LQNGGEICCCSSFTLFKIRRQTHCSRSIAHVLTLIVMIVHELIMITAFMIKPHLDRELIMIMTNRDQPRSRDLAQKTCTIFHRYIVSDNYRWNRVSIASILCIDGIDEYRWDREKSTCTFSNIYRVTYRSARKVIDEYRY